MSSFPSFRAIMAQGSSIVSLREIEKEMVYAVVDRRFVSGICVCKLRAQNGETFEVWATEALQDIMCSDDSMELPIWVAIPKSEGARNFINITPMPFTQSDLENNPWAMQCRQSKIPPRVSQQRNFETEEQG